MNVQLLFIVLYCFVATADARKLNKIKEQLRLNCHRPSFLTPKYIPKQTKPPNLILYPAVSCDLCKESTWHSGMTLPNFTMAFPDHSLA